MTETAESDVIQQDVKISQKALSIVEGLYSKSAGTVFCSSLKALFRIDLWTHGLSIEAVGLRNIRQTIQDINHEFDRLGISLPALNAPQSTGVLQGGEPALNQLTTQLSHSINTISPTILTEIKRLYALGVL